MLQLVSLMMLIYSYFLIRTNLPNLPARIPTHFNAAGVADGWGSPDTLWVLLGAQALTCTVFLVMPYLGQRFPGAVHFGTRRLSDFSPAQRARMLPLLNNMAGYLAVVMNLFFVWMLRQMLAAATEPNPHLSLLWPMVLLVGGALGVTGYYLKQLSRAGKGKGDGEAADDLTP
jgi:uncharacterized membrane protein